MMKGIRRWSFAAGTLVYLASPLGTGALAQVVEPGAVGEETASVARDSRYGPVSRTDNLWTIAEQYTLPPASVYQTVVAIYYLNPQAFLNGNIHRLLRDVYLTLPSQQQVQERSPRAAEAEYRRLSEGGARPPRLVAAPAATGRPEDALAQEPALLSPANQRQDERQSRLLDELQAQLTLSNAQLTELSRFNRELRQHVGELSDEVNELKVTREAPPAAESGWSAALAGNQLNLLLALAVLLLTLMLLLSLWWQRRGRQQPAWPRPPTPATGPEALQTRVADDRLVVQLAPSAAPVRDPVREPDKPAYAGLKLVEHPSRYVPALDEVGADSREPLPTEAPVAPLAEPDGSRHASLPPDPVAAEPLPPAEPRSAPVAPKEVSRSKPAPSAIAEREPEFRLEVRLDEYAAVLGHDDVDVDLDEGGIGAKLDLARAYLEIGEADSARSLLKQALKRGNAEQQQEAKKLLQRL